LHTQSIFLSIIPSASFGSLFQNILWHVGALLKRQLCERSDCETVSTIRQWRHVHRHVAICCATLGCDVTQQRCHGDESTVLGYYVTVRCWAIRRLFTGRPVHGLYNDSSIQNKAVTAGQLDSTVQFYEERVKLVRVSKWTQRRPNQWN
jgi:hypothetical protein